MYMDGCWTSQPASLEKHHEPKAGLQTMGQPSLQQTHICSRVVVGKGAQLRTIALVCARLLALVLKGPLSRPHYPGSEGPSPLWKPKDRPPPFPERLGCRRFRHLKDIALPRPRLASRSETDAQWRNPEP